MVVVCLLLFFQCYEYCDIEIDIYINCKGIIEVDIYKYIYLYSCGWFVEWFFCFVVYVYEDDLVVFMNKYFYVDIECCWSIFCGCCVYLVVFFVIDYDDEVYEIKFWIDVCGKMGEVWNGIIKDWIIVDVFFGIECVCMDGVGGVFVEVIW